MADDLAVRSLQSQLKQLGDSLKGLVSASGIVTFTGRLFASNDPRGDLEVATKHYVDSKSPTVLVGSALPVAQTSLQGRLFLVTIPGSADLLYVCRHDSAGNYGWALVGPTGTALSPSIAGVSSPSPSLLTVLATQSMAIADLRSQLMAFLNNAPTGTEPIVSVTATVTLTMPVSNTVYKVVPISNTVLTLPATTGSGRRLAFDLGALGAFTFALALSGSDAYQGSSSPASLYTSGSSFALRDLAAGVWGIE